MKIECVEQVELPFMLNIPSDEYTLGGAVGPYALQIRQEQVAAHLEDGRFAIGDATTLKNQFEGKVAVRHWQPLRTVVAHSNVAEIEEADFPLIGDESLHEAMQSKIIGENPMAFAGATEDLKAEATKRMNSLSTEEKAQFRLHEAIRAYAKQLADAPRFVDQLNTLIRAYMANFNDFFVEEVTLHQLSSNLPLRGVFTSVFCDGQPVHFYGHVGKIPPIMFKPWQNYPIEKITGLKSDLQAGTKPDALDLMAVRSRNYMEKGAYRSAIVEASAVLDLSLSSKIREGLRAKGQCDSDISDLLKKPSNQRFEERAKALLNSSVGTTVPALDNTLWADICQHRAVIRQGVTHSNEEPTQAEAEKVVNDFLKLAQMIRQIPVGSP